MTPLPGRWRLACLAVLTCAAALALTQLALAASPANNGPRTTDHGQPNIVIILIDDMGFSDLQCYGGDVPTPNINRLAAEGVRFTQFYNCARCCPTRASLLTGLYPHQAGVGDMTADQGAPGYRGFPQPNTVTIAKMRKTPPVGFAHLGKIASGAGR